jgi:DNA-binding MarR family transcriptional regulator
LSRFPDLDISAIDASAILEIAAQKVRALIFAPLSEQGISQARYWVLMCLSLEEQLGNEPPSPSVIADCLNVTRATMTQLLDGLEHEGLVERRPVGNDRRAQAIHLTEDGRTLFERLVPPVAAQVAHVFAPLTLAERQTLIELLSKLAAQDAAR